MGDRDVMGQEWGERSGGRRYLFCGEQRRLPVPLTRILRLSPGPLPLPLPRRSQSSEGGVGGEGGGDLGVHRSGHLGQELRSQHAETLPLGGRRQQQRSGSR